ncbi:hypothetical protein QR77_04590 [Streptomyces sp. 150FB]|uniref:TetR/AcrR family transcriptional regulator n=1 Tax=Streptomyces sp. 150FB TaxID=1576605 RepID=UPI00058910F7|nr:TetR/AcrR family transcriptional regulator [Streptomyces sp. 150FB]KIF78567.1 hypothetical protein QR77_04590 [Streptomyces sp. 150FB]
MAVANAEKSRPLRADARRNRDRLLSVALESFTREGPDVPLESIAREAGVGIGTLYRHFPTRETLVLAIYHREVEDLCEAAPRLLGELAPDQALRRWMDQLARLAMTKHGLGGALRDAATSESERSVDTYGRLVGAVSTLLDACVAAGTARSDLDPEDVLLSMGGLFMLRDKDGWQDQARRMSGLLMDGLRAGAPNPPATDSTRVSGGQRAAR